MDLNYILVSCSVRCNREPFLTLPYCRLQHYPKLKKYISLFPPEVRRHSEADDADAEKGKAKEREAETASTDAQREEIRSEIRERMQRGALSMEPEREQQNPKTERAKEGGREKPQALVQKSRPKPAPDIKEDAFFGEDEEEGDVASGSGTGEEDDDMESE